MSWGSRRKSLYIGTTSIVVLIIGSVLGYWLFSQEETCFDRTKNGDERGVDCGGACARICMEDTRQPVVLWSRAFKVADGFYSAAAYIENGNASAQARGARYVFRLYDANNLLVAERFGEVSIAAQRIVPVVEANITTGNRIPVRTFFEFVGDLEFTKIDEPAKFRIKDQLLDEVTGTFSVTVINDGRTDLNDIVVPAVLFDAEGNAIAASRSVIERLKGGGEERVTFTWPSALPPITRAEVIPYSNK